MIGEPVHLNPPAHHHELLHRIHIGEAFSYGWRTVIADPVPWMTMTAIALGIATSAGFASEGAGVWWIALAGLVIASAVTFLLIPMALEATKGREVMTVAALARPSQLVGFLIATLLYGVGTAVSFALLVIPGFIFLAALFFYGFFIADLNLGPVEALRESRDLTRGQRGRILTAGLVAVAVNLLGVAAFGVGVIVSIPITVVAAADIYEQLREEPIADPV